MPGCLGARSRPGLLPAGRLGTLHPRTASPPGPHRPAWPACRSTSAKPSGARTPSALPWLSGEWGEWGSGPGAAARPAPPGTPRPAHGPARGRGGGSRLPPPPPPPPAIPLMQRDASPPAPAARRPPAPHAAPRDAWSPPPPRTAARQAGREGPDNAPPSRAGPDRRAVAGSLHGPMGATRPGVGGGPPRPAPSRREGVSQQPLLLGSPTFPFS